MLPVTTLDAAMILAETAEMPLHTMGILILEPPEGTSGMAYEAMRLLFEARLYLVPPFRRRLVQGPLQIGDLRWIEDPDFDLDKHLLRATLPAPGGNAELAALVGEYTATLLDRTKPLWEVMLVEGLEGGRVAAVTKVHHAAMDGGRLVALLSYLFDRSPDGILEPAGQDPWKGEKLPGTLWLAADTIRTLAGKPGRIAHALADIAGSVGRSMVAKRRHGRADAEAGAGAGAGGGSRAPGWLGEAETGTPSGAGLGVTNADASAGASAGADSSDYELPPTPWSGALSTHRSVAFSDVPLDDLRTIRAAFGTTINDVVLAATTTSLRRWLAAHDALPDRPLLANVPIAVRGEGDSETSGNKVSLLRVHLPVVEEDPVTQLLQIHAETARSKKEHRQSGGNVFERLTDVALNLTVPWLLTHAVGIYSKSGAADYVPFFWNVVVSNVPGPTHDLYCAGTKVTRIYPFGPVQQGSGLNLTVLSTTEHMCFGAVACREQVPELDDIARGFVEGIGELLRRAKETTVG